jgi:hypothetical protein
MHNLFAPPKSDGGSAKTPGAAAIGHGFWGTAAKVAGAT